MKNGDLKLRRLCIVFAVIITVALVLFFLAHFFYTHMKQEYAQPALMSSAGYNPANNMQICSSDMQLFAYNGKLYYWETHYDEFNPTSEYVSTVFVFGEDKPEAVSELSMDVIAAQGDYLYGLAYPKNREGVQILCCYNLATGQQTELDTVVTHNPGTSKPDLYCYTYPHNGTLFVAKDYTNQEKYISMKDGRILEKETEQSYFDVGGYIYYLDEGVVKCQNEDVARRLSQEISEEGDKYLLDTEYGLLVFNLYDKTNLLYLIKDNAEVLTLFADSKRSSKACINVHGEYVYLSLIRYDVGNELFISCDRDPLMGTYKICLKDGSVEKISDTTYSFMYIFDDSGIFATGYPSTLYHLDFDGNVISKIYRYDI